MPIASLGSHHVYILVEQSTDKALERANELQLFLENYCNIPKNAVAIDSTGTYQGVIRRLNDFPTFRFSYLIVLKNDGELACCQVYDDTSSLTTTEKKKREKSSSSSRRVSEGKYRPFRQVSFKIAIEPDVRLNPLMSMCKLPTLGSSFIIALIL